MEWWERAPILGRLFFCSYAPPSENEAARFDERVKRFSLPGRARREARPPTPDQVRTWKNLVCRARPERAPPGRGPHQSALSRGAAHAEAGDVDQLDELDAQNVSREMIAPPSWKRSARKDHRGRIQDHDRGDLRATVRATWREGPPHGRAGYSR